MQEFPQTAGMSRERPVLPPTLYGVCLLRMRLSGHMGGDEMVELRVLVDACSMDTRWHCTVHPGDTMESPRDCRYGANCPLGAIRPPSRIRRGRAERRRDVADGALAVLHSRSAGFACTCRPVRARALSGDSVRSAARGCGRGRRCGGQRGRLPALGPRPASSLRAVSLVRVAVRWPPVADRHRASGHGRRDAGKSAGC